MIASIKDILRYPILQRWNIGFSSTPIEDIISGTPISFQWVEDLFSDRWFADPFILDVTEDYYVVLAEDYLDSRKYAVLSRLIIDRHSLRIKDIKQILDVGSHLSFPNIYRRGNRVFVYPENSNGGGLKLYEYDFDKEELVFVKAITSEPLTDAVILDAGDERFLFATKLPDPNGSILSVYSLDDDDDLVACKSIVMDNKTARMGGNFFNVRGLLYRPAQDNNIVYGGAVVLQQVIREEASWRFKDIRRIESPHPSFSTGLHTFNVYKGIVVVDVHGYRRHPRLSAFLDKLRSII